MAFLGKLFGSSKSEKDVKKLMPYVAETNKHFASYQSLTNDQLRNKTNEFFERISFTKWSISIGFLIKYVDTKVGDAFLNSS